jgi:hypothetical protein
MSVSDRVMKSELAKHEAVIERGMRTTIEVGMAMKAIYDQKLYEGQYKTFEAYAKGRWGYGKSRAYQLIEAAEVDLNLSTIVDCDRPQNESQLREVAKAPPEKQAEVVKKAVEKSAEENRQPTAKDYKEAVKQVVGELVDESDEEIEEPKQEPKPEETHHPRQMAGPLMAHVKTLVQMLNDLKKRKEERGGEWIDVQAISMQISALKYSLKSSIYCADCPACGGKRCEKCKQTGFLPELKSASSE